MKTQEPSVAAAPKQEQTRQDSHVSAAQPKRRWPVGAEVLGSGGVHFRVWAPCSKRTAVLLCADAEWSQDKTTELEMRRESGGYFSLHVPNATAGMLYKFRLDSGVFPDPASRFQPEGPFGPSQVVDPGKFGWTDRTWKGVPRDGQVIYEMHIGTFTRAGTWRAAMQELPELARIGITVLEVMPVADFPGRYGWGYDGVDLFAPTRLYGTPDDFRAFVNCAHELGLGVILDVVYNHIGPDGNFLKEFSPDYFTDRYANEWGEALNFDGENSRPVREFFISNAGYWIDEFHLDGLRLDATQQIFDSSPEHVLAEISRCVRRAGNGRSTYLVAENEEQNSTLIRSCEEGGCGMDAVWNDDLHHSAIVALTGKNEAYYSDFKGTPQEFISGMKWGYLFQGQWFTWQKKSRGKPALGAHPACFVNYLQNHDQVANSLRGDRVHQLASPGVYRALTALFLLGPGTPMLFQGQEFAASAPFLFFADHNPELAKLVKRGRKQFVDQFPSIAAPGSEGCYIDPKSELAFEKCKLDFSEREKHRHAYELHRDLLRLRKEDPVFSRPRPRGVDGAVLGPDCFVLRFFGQDNDDRLLVVNLGVDLTLVTLAEPLLAPVDNTIWKLAWSSEDPRYGGLGVAPMQTGQQWRIPGRAAAVLVPEAIRK